MGQIWVAIFTYFGMNKEDAAAWTTLVLILESVILTGLNTVSYTHLHPSLEIEEAENAIYNNNISDITDVMIQMVEELKGENK